MKRCETCGRVVTKITKPVFGWVDRKCHKGYRTATTRERILFDEGYEVDE